MDPKDYTPTAEELAAEQTASQAPKEDEVRANIIAEYGFDETTDAERIEKLTKKELDSHSKLSAAIGQKIKYREAAKAAKPAEVVVPKPVVEQAKPEAIDVDKAVAKQFEQRDLEEMPYTEDLKKEIQRIANVQGISVKAAARDPYIVYKIGEEEREGKTEAATIGNKQRGGSKKVATIDSPPDVDMATPEGRKAWQEYKDAMKKAGN